MKSAWQITLLALIHNVIDSVTRFYSFVLQKKKLKVFIFFLFLFLFLFFCFFFKCNFFSVFCKSYHNWTVWSSLCVLYFKKKNWKYSEIKILFDIWNLCGCDKCLLKAEKQQRMIWSILHVFLFMNPLHDIRGLAAEGVNLICFSSPFPPIMFAVYLHA